jgi:hypothetical protein
LEFKQKTLWLPQLFNAFRKHDQYISDVFIIVNDDALDILLDVNELYEQLCWFSFKKQAATASATADEFDAFLSLSELFSLSQLFI